MEMRVGLVFIEEMVEENAILEFCGNVCFKADHQLGLKGVDRLFLFTRHGLVKCLWWVALA
jgi:glycerol-3-phosphate responsive antiterminator